MHGVLEWTDVDVNSEQLQWDGAVPVVSEQRSDRGCHRFDVHSADGLECRDVRVHAGCDMWQLQCDVEQRDGDGESDADGGNQRQWFGELVHGVFERTDVEFNSEQLQWDGAVPVVSEQRSDRGCHRFIVHSADGYECRDVRVHAGCHVWQLQFDVQQCDGDGESDADGDD